MKRISNKGMLYIFDVMVIISLLFHFGAVSITQYFIGVEHTPATQIVEVNPATRNSGLPGFEENKQEVYEPMSDFYKVYLNMKWNIWISMIAVYSFLTTMYMLTRRKVVRNNYEDCFELNMLAMLVIFMFMLFLKDFTNDFSYLLGAIKGGGL